jgi:hypothetical protein
MKSFQRGWLAAAVLTVGLSFGTARIVAAPSPQEHSHDDDYSRNPRYQEGMQDGKDTQRTTGIITRSGTSRKTTTRKHTNTATSRVTMMTATIATITKITTSTIADRESQLIPPVLLPGGAAVRQPQSAVLVRNWSASAANSSTASI